MRGSPRHGRLMHIIGPEVCLAGGGHTPIPSHPPIQQPLQQSLVYVKQISRGELGSAHGLWEAPQSGHPPRFEGEEVKKKVSGREMGCF